MTAPRNAVSRCGSHFAGNYIASSLSSIAKNKFTYLGLCTSDIKTVVRKGDKKSKVTVLSS